MNDSGLRQDADAIQWRPYTVADCLVLTPTGDLDATTYRGFRDDLVTFALAEPRALILIIDQLRITSRASLRAISSAWLRINDWPGVPIHLVAHDDHLRTTMTHSPLARYVPVHATTTAALADLDDPPLRRRSEIALPPIATSSRLARRFVERTCADWDITDRLTDAMEVATELVENAIIHAGTDMCLRLELHAGRLAVAVRDGSPAEAVLRERGPRPANGLRLVSHLATTWGSTPDMSGGKVVWAVLSG